MPETRSPTYLSLPEELEKLSGEVLFSTVWTNPVNVEEELKWSVTLFNVHKRKSSHRPVFHFPWKPEHCWALGRGYWPNALNCYVNSATSMAPPQPHQTKYNRSPKTGSPCYVMLVSITKCCLFCSEFFAVLKEGELVSSCLACILLLIFHNSSMPWEIWLTERLMHPPCFSLPDNSL